MHTLTHILVDVKFFKTNFLKWGSFKKLTNVETNKKASLKEKVHKYVDRFFWPFVSRYMQSYTPQVLIFEGSPVLAQQFRQIWMGWFLTNPVKAKIFNNIAM